MKYVEYGIFFLFEFSVKTKFYEYSTKTEIPKFICEKFALLRFAEFFCENEILRIFYDNRILNCEKFGQLRFADFFFCEDAIFNFVQKLTSILASSSCGGILRP